MTLALEGALESGSIVLLRESAEPADDDLAAVAAAARADAVAVVTWSDADRRAHLRLQRVGAGGPAERDIEFQPSDASVERGRTIGFALAAMIRSPEEPPSSDARLPPTALPVGQADERSQTAARREAASASRWGIDLAFTTMAGLGGAASGLGADVGVGRSVAPTIDFRVSLGVTRGAVTAAGATLTIVRPRAGVGVEVLRRGALSLTLRLEAGPWLHVVDRAAPSSAGGRWVPALRPGGELAWAVAPPVAAILDVGADLALGTTRVLVGDDERASIPPVRLVGALGLRLMF